MSAIPTNWADNIGMSVNAAYLNNLGTEVNASTNARPQSGLFSALPAAGNPGRTYWATDAGVVLKDNGTSWDVVGGNGQPAFTLPTSSGWSTNTLGPATFAASKGGRVLSIPSAANQNFRVEYRTLSPASNYTAAAAIDVHASVPTGYFHSGLVLMDSATGKFIHFGTSKQAATSTMGVQVRTWTNATTWLTILAHNVFDLMPPPRWLRIRDDNTERYYEYSINGQDWKLLWTETRTTFITPDKIGWGADNSTGAAATLRLNSFSVA